MRSFLLAHADKHPISFHMPGHKGAEIFRRYGYGEFLDRFVDCDITEIPGADNLFQAEGIIMETQKKYARLYGVDHSYLMINGTSGGLIASILAAVRPGHKLIMARNCHKAVFNALTLGGIQPVYARPQMIREHGIMGAVSPEEIARCIDENPDADAVILPSPNYYGICSDIRSIARICHAAGKVLIVDQAHGAHLKFFHLFGQGEGMPPAAEDCGADLVVGSIHKTMASLTQSAVLNLQGDLVDRYALEDRIQAIESTSPSYILMSFLDINADLLLQHGEEAIGQWRRNVDWFYDHAKAVPGLVIMGTGSTRTDGMSAGSTESGVANDGSMFAGSMDLTKINLNMGALGIDGAKLEQLLMERNIFSELYTGDILMLMTGIGNTREHMEKTLQALQEIADQAGRAVQVRNGADIPAKTSGTAPAKDGAQTSGDDAARRAAYRVPAEGRLHAIPKKKEYVPLSEAAGRISAGSIIPYPPGIPFVCPGEEITEDIVRYIRALRGGGEKVIGVNDQQQVLVGVRQERR